MKFLKNITIYYLIIAFLFALCLLGALQFGPLIILQQIIPVLFATVLTDSVVKYFKLKIWKIFPSAIITGLIIGLVGQFGENPFKLSLIGVLAVFIKTFVKFDGRHIFNPAGASLLAGIILLNSHPSWWVGGDNVWIFLIWITVLLMKMKRWAPMLGFLMPVILTGGYSIIFSASALFFISVMLIEPKTSPIAVKQGLIYGIICALVYILVGRFFSSDPILIGLLVSNLTARIIARYI